MTQAIDPVNGGTPTANMNHTSSDRRQWSDRTENNGRRISPAGYDGNLRQIGRHETVCVVGLGYVGIPLAVQFARNDFDVIGYDVDRSKIASLEDGVDVTRNCSRNTLQAENLSFTADPEPIADARFVIVTVPTPVDTHNVPNLEYVRAAGRTIGAQLTAGTTVILESTVYPGAVREVFVPALESASGLSSPESFSVGYSPERISPGEVGRGLDDVVKIVSGQTDEIREEIASLYETIVDAGVYRAPSIEVAEASKVIENAQRDLNIAFVNELAMAFERMEIDIDTHEVLDAAGTKWNFHDYRPGLVGGHCIPVDPHFFCAAAERDGFVPELMRKARQVNEAVPNHVAELTVKELAANGKQPGSSTVLLLGLTYKADVPDVRTAAIDGVARHLGTFGVSVRGYDPVGDYAEIRETFDFPIDDHLSFEGLDGVVLATSHTVFDEIEPNTMARALNADPVLVDVPGMFDRSAVCDAGISYRRL